MDNIHKMDCDNTYRYLVEKFGEEKIVSGYMGCCRNISE